MAAEAVPDRGGSLAEPEVLRVAELGEETLRRFFAPWQVELVGVEDGAPIPGSFFGEPEAGVRGSSLFVRGDTPVHSALHEGFHIVCARCEGRTELDRDAGGDDIEEVAVCYLQLAAAEALPGFGFERACHDMDAWGYTFRRGSARAWFEGDAEEAVVWLCRRGLLAAGSATPPVTPGNPPGTSR